MTNLPCPSVRHLAGAAAIICALACPAPALAQTGAGAHVTRTVQVFTQLEESLLQAIRSRDEARLQALLDDEFEMIVARAPDAPVPREDWLANVRKPGAGDYSVEQVSVREIVEVAVVSFVLRPKVPSTRASPVFVIDTWQRDGVVWRLTQRHAAPVAGSRRAIPGDSGRTGVPKQI
jgi:hypothetical protein